MYNVYEDDEKLEDMNNNPEKYTAYEHSLARGVLLLKKEAEEVKKLVLQHVKMLLENNTICYNMKISLTELIMMKNEETIKNYIISKIDNFIFTELEKKIQIQQDFDFTTQSNRYKSSVIVISQEEKERFLNYLEKLI